MEAFVTRNTVLRVEALRAKHGDCLLLLYGDPDRPRIGLIDGGPGGVWKEALEPRLAQLREDRAPEPLSIGLMMVSHIDDDHIDGLIQLSELLREQRGEDDPFLEIDLFWHNSFDDLVGAAGGAGSGPIEAGGFLPSSVTQGQRLRDNAAALAWNINGPFDGSVRAGVDQSVVELPDGLTITVLGPDEDHVTELHHAWDKELMKREAKFGTSEYLDESFSNLASIVVLLEAEGRTVLLTGDARGDDIMEGARAAGVLDGNDRLALDVLKVPHHGSNRNVDVDFFQMFPADHYVISGDGSHGNPEVDTFRMLFDARSDDTRPFTIHLTYDPASYKPARHRRGEPAVPYPIDRLRELFAKQERSGREFKVAFPNPGEVSVSIDLG